MALPQIALAVGFAETQLQPSRGAPHARTKRCVIASFFLINQNVCLLPTCTRQ